MRSEPLKFRASVSRVLPSSAAMPDMVSPRRAIFRQTPKRRPGLLELLRRAFKPRGREAKGDAE